DNFIWRLRRKRHEDAASSFDRGVNSVPRITESPTARCKKARSASIIRVPRIHSSNINVMLISAAVGARPISILGQAELLSCHSRPHCKHGEPHRPVTEG